MDNAVLIFVKRKRPLTIVMAFSLILLSTLLFPLSCLQAGNDNGKMRPPQEVDKRHSLNSKYKQKSKAEKAKTWTEEDERKLQKALLDQGLF